MLIIGAISVSAGGSFNSVSVDSTRLKTVHSRGDLTDRIVQAVDKANRGEIGVYYVNEETISTVEPGQSRVLGTLKRNQNGFIHSILDEKSPVKYKTKEQIDTPQFKRYLYSMNAAEHKKRTDGDDMAAQGRSTSFGSCISIAEMLDIVKRND